MAHAVRLLPDQFADPMDERIIRAAYACFERFGVRKTTIEDIATAASVSRPTVYKHYAGKDAIVDRICTLESFRVNADIRAALKKGDGLAETLTRCLLLSVRSAGKNPYIRRFLENVSAASASADPKGHIHQVQRDRWGSLLERGREDGTLAPDLSVDDVVSWLTLSQALLLIKVDAVETSDADLAAFIRRFIVEPLLARGDRP